MSLWLRQKQREKSDRGAQRERENTGRTPGGVERRAHVLVGEERGGGRRDAAEEDAHDLLRHQGAVDEHAVGGRGGGSRRRRRRHAGRVE